MDLRDKEVIVIDENNKETSVKQFCKCILDKDLVLLSNTGYDNSNKIYHKYLDCYEDWPYPSNVEFEKWKLEYIDKLEGYKECARCMERKYREQHPEARVTGYDFHYYYEDI